MSKIDDYVDKIFITNNAADLEVYRFIPDEAHVYMISTDRRLWPTQNGMQELNLLPYVESMLNAVITAHLGLSYSPGIARI